MRKLLVFLAVVAFACSAQAQLILKAGNDGKVFEPNPVTLPSPVLQSPVLSGTATGTYTLGGTPTISAPEITYPFNTYAVDGAVTIASQVAYLTKGSAGAYTLAAPGAAGIGKIIHLTTGTDFAHVVTFTGTTLQDGTAGANTTWTAAAVQGSSLTVVGVTATKWNVLSFNLGTIAP